MLILSRRHGEKIVIGEDIVLSVVELRGDIVKIGIEAPRHVKVYREEVFEAIRSQNAAAVASDVELPNLDLPGTPQWR